MKKARSFKLSPDLEDAADVRAKQLGYPSFSAYHKALIRWDIATLRDHGRTLKWARSSPQLQDQLDAELLERVKGHQPIIKQ